MAVTVPTYSCPSDEALLDRDPAVVDVEVGAAHAARLDPDDRLVGRAQLGLGHVVDPHLSGALEGHRPHRAALYGYLAGTCQHEA